MEINLVNNPESSSTDFFQHFVLSFELFGRVSWKLETYFSIF